VNAVTGRAVNPVRNEELIPTLGSVLLGLLVESFLNLLRFFSFL
jgi:hypothetical protein